jgi:rhodanese-related sulfurtransferase
MVQTVQRALLIVLLGAGIGLLTNALAPNGIPLITPPKQVPKQSEFIPLEKAHELWSSGGALFFDARKPDDFQEGHIANALSLPVEEFQEHYPKVAPMLAPDSAIVAYCNGKECELSHRLATELRQLGYTNVHILYNGWTAWKEAGFPVESGPAK